jgi:predicted aspartyl protease
VLTLIQGESLMRRKSLMIAAILAGFATPAFAQTAPAPAATPTPAGESVVDTGLDAVQRLTVPVMINGQGPYNFVIDTGADRTVVSQELAAKLGLPKGRKARLHAMGGSAEVRLVKVDTLQVSNNVSRKIEAAALPFKNLGADGLLGIDSLKNQRIVLDFVSNTMRLEPSTAPEAAVPVNSEVIVVTARTRLGQLVLVDADANGQKVWVVVDTGSSNSVGNNRLRKLMLRRNPSTPIKPVEMVDVLGKRTPADYTIVGKLRIGGIMLGNAAVAFADAHPFKLFELTGKPSMLLGMESLRSFRRVSVDFATRKVKFLLPEGSNNAPPAGQQTAALN